MPTVALRTSLVWHDEVMDDIVFDEPEKITLGSSGRDTFTIPNCGLPQNFAIMQPGNRGYLLTLGARMRGTICIDGQEQSVEDFVKNGSGGGDFHATPISGRDWGVIDLDESGNSKLFFQFVPIEEEREAVGFITKKMAVFGLVGNFVAAIALSVVFELTKHHGWGESGARGFLFALIPITIGMIGWFILVLDLEAQLALIFSVILHTYLLYWTYKLFDPNEDPFQYPGPKEMAGQYLITRLEDAPEPEPPKPTTNEVKKQEAAAPKSPEKPNNAATKGAEGAAGGEGEKERARDKDATNEKPVAPKVAFFDDKNKKYLDNIIDRNLDLGLDKFRGIKGDVTTVGSIGFGPGKGTGAGPGEGTGTTRGSKNNGTGGNGFSDQDIVRNKGPIDTGKNRPGGNCTGPNCTGTGPKEVKVALADPGGDFGGLTAEEINKVVKARAGVFRACYQKELNRTPGLGGKLVMKFKIDGNGVVQSATKGGGSTMSNDAVESCVAGNVMRLKFPAKGGVANVNYPFVFSQGG